MCSILNLKEVNLQTILGSCLVISILINVILAMSLGFSVQKIESMKETLKWIETFLSIKKEEITTNKGEYDV